MFHVSMDDILSSQSYIVSATYSASIVSSSACVTLEHIPRHCEHPVEHSSPCSYRNIVWYCIPFCSCTLLPPAVPLVRHPCLSGLVNTSHRFRTTTIVLAPYRLNVPPNVVFAVGGSSLVSHLWYYLPPFGGSVAASENPNCLLAYLCTNQLWPFHLLLSHLWSCFPDF